MKILYAGLSDTGRLRPSNEDSFGLFPEIGLFVVADGMGGHAAGEVASRLAVESTSEFIRKIVETQGKGGGDDLVRGIKEANHRIYLSSIEDPSLQGMGTTLVALFFNGDQVSVASVGDSRGYLIRNGRIEQLTRDHSLVNEYVERGVLTPEAAEHHPLKHVISRALGTGAEVEVDLLDMPLTVEDRYLLCSDGLSNKLTTPEILDIVIRSQDDIQIATQRMIEAANKKGGEDNITLIHTLCKRDTL